MSNRAALIFLCFLAPLLAGAGTLDIYANLTGKTVLMPSTLPLLPDSMIADLPPDKTNAIARIERALSEKGLEVVQDGPHFVRVFPSAARSSLTNAPLRGLELAARSGNEASPGIIDFKQADLSQVLAIYAVMSRRTILRAAILPAPWITLKSQCALTPEEAEYALATVLALNGITVVEDGESFVQMVPTSHHTETRAPKREPDAKLFDPKKVPAMGFTDGPKPAFPPPKPRTEMERVEQQFERLRKAFYDFMHPSDPRKPAARRLFELYARLADKTAVPSPKFDGTGIWFHVETPLTRAELLYAIETTFALNNLAIVPVDDHSIRLGHISEVRKGNGKQLQYVPPKP